MDGTSLFDQSIPVYAGVCVLQEGHALINSSEEYLDEVHQSQSPRGLETYRSYSSGLMRSLPFILDLSLTSEET
jgi:hypothetical protein